MALLITVCGKTPQVGKNCFLAENCTLAGEVFLDDECSIWFGAVLRGDVAPIFLGKRVNVQDGAVLHGSYGKSKVIIGNEVTIGHRAIVHGAIVKDYALIGMGAIVLDNAEVGEGAVVAAGAVVPEGTRIEAGTLWAGIPARRIKKISDNEGNSYREIASHYTGYASWYR